MDELSGDCVVTVDDFATHIRQDPADPAVRERMVAALNDATAAIAIITGRRLRSFVHRVPFTVGNVAFVNNDPEAGETLVASQANVFEAVRIDDAVSGTGAAPETRVVFNDIGGGGLYLAPAYSADLSLTPLTLTFGTGALYASGNGSSELFCPEWPVAELLGAAYRDGTAWIDIDTSEAILDPSGGSSIVLANGYFPRGSANVRLEVRTGFVRPQSEREVGDPRKWATLRRLWLRVGEVCFMDNSVLRGRSSGFAGVRGSAETPLDAAAWPDDVWAMAQEFVRWA